MVGQMSCMMISSALRPSSKASATMARAPERSPAKRGVVNCSRRVSTAGMVSSCGVGRGEESFFEPSLEQDPVTPNRRKRGLLDCFLLGADLILQPFEDSCDRACLM